MWMRCRGPKRKYDTNGAGDDGKDDSGNAPASHVERAEAQLAFGRSQSCVKEEGGRNDVAGVECRDAQ